MNSVLILGIGITIGVLAGFLLGSLDSYRDYEREQSLHWYWYDRWVELITERNASPVVKQEGPKC